MRKDNHFGLAFVFLGLLIFTAAQTVQLTQLKNHCTKLRIEVVAAQQESTGQKTVSPYISVKQPETPAEQEYELLDVPLPDEMQIYTQMLCNQYEVPYRIILAIGEHESQWQDVGEIIDRNGMASIGYMQINQPHWQYLKDLDIDVHTDEGNIEAGIYILAQLLKKYPLEKALVAYQCGETGAKGIDSTEFSRWIIARGEEYGQKVVTG